MVATTLNAGPADPVTQALLSEHLHAFSDVDVIAGQVNFPCHRAVLAVHSHDFRHIFSASNTPEQPETHTSQIHLDGQPPTPAPTPTSNVASSSQVQMAASCAPTKYRVHINVDDASDESLHTGWRLVHSYIYGAEVMLTTDAVLAALPICRRYRFDELARALDAFLVDGAVDPQNCTRVFAAALTGRSGRRDADAEMVQRSAWSVMKGRFEEVRNWGAVPYAALVRLLKLNDLNVASEKVVFDAVAEWVLANRGVADDDVVASLAKLVRFPTMSQGELDDVADSTVVVAFPTCRKYLSRGFAARADEKRGLVRSVVMESSPVYRRRRTDALTFSDRVVGWSRVEGSVNTSSRYFAGCLWNLIVEVGGEWVGLHLGCLSDSDEREVDVELDFSVFVVRHGGGEVPELVAKEVKGAGFGTSGQRIGFGKMIGRKEVEEGRFLLRDTLFIGASLRLRCSKAAVVGISDEGDDTAESESKIT